MGNAPSAVEGPDRGRRIAHKLSKPRTSSHASNSVMNPNGLMDSRRRFSTLRTQSLPYGTSPAPSPVFSPSEAGETSLTGDQSDSSPIKRSKSLFRSMSSRRYSRHGSNAGVALPASTQPSRANSVAVGAADSSQYAQASNVGWLGAGTAGSRMSMNYDLTSYEAKRLLNLMEEHPYESNSIMSEGQFHIEGAASPSPRPRAPSETAVATSVSISRANSDISLYTPMRRRSTLLTPGIATRAPDPPPLPRKSKKRFSLPSTPARRDSLEAFPPLVVDDYSITRAVTPCEEDYQHTGAFKIGSLRITNGSPVRSPAAHLNEADTGNSWPLPAGNEARDYFHNQTKESDEFQTETILDDPSEQPAYQSPAHLTPPTNPYSNHNSGGSMSLSEASNLLVKPWRSPDFLPEIQLSPLSLDGSELQITSKHTAMEDDLFVEESAEYSKLEVLDVRVDPNAKSLLPQPGMMPEDRDSLGVSRSDSGFGPSPGSECPQKPLTKADSGYSSNASLRSLSKKPHVLERKPLGASQMKRLPSPPPKDSSPSEIHTIRVPVVPKSEAAPPVPEKDNAEKEENLWVLKDSSPSGRQNMRPLRQSTWSKKSRNSPSPITNMRSLGGYAASPTSPASTSSTTSMSTLSIGSNSRRPGRLSRLLSSARKPLTVHTNHPLDPASVPPVPKEVQAKFAEHYGLFPVSVKRLVLKTVPSTETLGTIFSVGSSEIPLDKDLPVPNVPENIEEERNDQSPRDNSERQHAAITNMIPAQKPIIRKPVPLRRPTQNAEHSRTESVAVNSTPEDKSTTRETRRMSWDTRTYNTRFLAMANGREAYYTPKVARSNTMTAQVERNLNMNHAVNQGSTARPAADSRPSNFLEPPAIALNTRRQRTPPPVSMRKGSGGPLRMHPPLRPHSTPPEVVVSGMAPMFSWQTSRENIQGCPVANASSAPISRKSSRENIQSYQPTYQVLQGQEQQINLRHPTNRQRSMSFMTDSGQIRVRPNWEVQTDHDCDESLESFSRRSSVGHIRQNSLNRQVSLYSNSLGRYNSLSSQPNRPTSAMGKLRPSARPQWDVPPVPVLLRRPSYEEVAVTEEEAHSCYNDNGPYPSMPHRDGHTYVTDPWSGRPMQQEWGQYGSYAPPRVPRGHHRNRSLDQFGNPSPYRVLHSYYTPAYRNVPIWG